MIFRIIQSFLSWPPAPLVFISFSIYESQRAEEMEHCLTSRKLTRRWRKQAEEPLNLAAGQRAGTSYVNDVGADGEGCGGMTKSRLMFNGPVMKESNKEGIFRRLSCETYTREGRRASGQPGASSDSRITQQRISESTYRWRISFRSSCPPLSLTLSLL